MNGRGLIIGDKDGKVVVFDGPNIGKSFGFKELIELIDSYQ